jgi:hypothetical protein
MSEVETVEKPDERRDFPRGHLEALHPTGLDFAVATSEPGRRRSEPVVPVTGTESRRVHHNGCAVRGRTRLRMDDGREAEAGPGDVLVRPPGHDARAAGDEAVVMYGFAGAMAEEYARSAQMTRGGETP